MVLNVFFRFFSLFDRFHPFSNDFLPDLRQVLRFLIKKNFIRLKILNYEVLRGLRPCLIIISKDSPVFF